MRKTLKISAVVVGGIVSLAFVYLVLLLFPDASFAHEVEHGRFTVHSNKAYDDELKRALDDVQAALETSEIYDPTLRHDIYFGLDAPFFRALHSPLGVTYNLSMPPYLSEITVLRTPHFAANQLTHPNFRGSTNLRQVLAHEVTHTFLRAKLGFIGVARSPMWKQEGYAEFVGASTTTLANPDYDIRASVRRIVSTDLSWAKDNDGNFTEMHYGCSWLSSLQNEEGFQSPSCYYTARVLWEYLINVKGLKFDDVMKPEVTGPATLRELIKEYGPEV